MTLTTYPTNFTPLCVTLNGVLCDIKVSRIGTPNGTYGGWSGGQAVVPFERFAYRLTEEQKRRIRHAKRTMCESDYFLVRQKAFSECLACVIAPLIVGPMSEAEK